MDSQHFQVCSHPGEHLTALNVSLDLLMGDVAMERGSESRLRLQIHREHPPHRRRPWGRAHSSARRRDDGLHQCQRRDHHRGSRPGCHPDSQDPCKAGLDPGPREPRSPDWAPGAPAFSAVGDEREQDAWRAVLRSDFVPLSLCVGTGGLCVMDSW